MKHTSPFVISEFANPSGKIAFQLYARLDGKRFRKNFQTRAEAEAERQVQEMQLLQRETGSRVAATRLTDEQLHEAESVFCRIAGHAHSLSFYVEFALTNYRAPVMQKPLAEAIAAFVASKDIFPASLWPTSPGRDSWSISKPAGRRTRPLTTGAGSFRPSSSSLIKK